MWSCLKKLRTKHPCDPPSRCKSKGNTNRRWRSPLHPRVPGSIIHNSQDPETTQVSTKGRVDEEDVACAYDGAEGLTCDDTDGPGARSRVRRRKTVRGGARPWAYGARTDTAGTVGGGEMLVQGHELQLAGERAGDPPHGAMAADSNAALCAQMLQRVARNGSYHRHTNRSGDYASGGR